MLAVGAITADKILKFSTLHSSGDILRYLLAIFSEIHSVSVCWA